MAFKVQILRGTTSYTISDPSDPDCPFSIETADLGGAAVRNIEERGPYQDGATHLDERLEPDTITLRINVRGSSPSDLDSKRDTLNKMFKPVYGVPITLKVTRDDGEVRQLDTRRTGKLAIPLVAINRPGNLHRAVVQLRAADPAWYDPVIKSEDFLVPSDWWLAYNSIGTADVMEHVENPAQGQLWAHSGSVAPGSPWTIAFRSGSVPLSATFRHAFYHEDTPGFFGGIAFTRRANFEDSFFAGVLGVSNEGNFMGPGTQNYFLVNDGSVVFIYRNTTLVGSTGFGHIAPIRGTADIPTRWRSDKDNTATSRWTEELPHAAVYRIALDDNQHELLNLAMTAGSAFSLTIPYEGDVDSYPLIMIRGVADPVITNTTTGDVLDFTGGTAGLDDLWTIDLRYGRKSALNTSGSSVANFLSTDSDLATFRLVPDPVAPDGVNVITLGGSALGTATSVLLSYRNRYISF